MPVTYREQQTQKQQRLKFGPWLPFILPLPLLIAIVASLLKGNIIALIASMTGLSCFWAGAWFLKKAREVDWHSQQRKWARSSRFPWRLFAALLTSLGIATVSFFLIGHNPIISVIAATIGFFGIRLRYGKDPQHDKQKDVTLVGITTEELIEIFDEAEQNLDAIESAAKKIHNPELKIRLSRIATKTRKILDLIEQDPKDLRRARKFLKVYLSGAQKVSTQYAKTHSPFQQNELEQNFRNVLTTIEDVIEEQTVKLTENNILDLDVKIEVLQSQLKNEGVI